MMSNAEYRMLRALLETLREDNRFWEDIRGDEAKEHKLRDSVDELIANTYSMAG